MRIVRRLLLWIPRLIVFHFYYRAGVRFGAADYALRKSTSRSSPFIPQEPTEPEWQVIRTGRKLSRHAERIYKLGGRPIPRYLWWEVSQSDVKRIIRDAVFVD